jgi:hypothetical protein
MWISKVQENYSSLEELISYDEIYDIARRLGYSDVEKLWNDNPTIQGSTNPNDLKVVRSMSKSTHTEYYGIKYRSIMFVTEGRYQRVMLCKGLYENEKGVIFGGWQYLNKKLFNRGKIVVNGTSPFIFKPISNVKENNITSL